MTGQIPETLILDGEAQAMTFCPPIPDDPRLIREVRIELIQAGPGNAQSRRVAKWTDADGQEHEEEEERDMVFSTACWRQYRGTWEIKDGKLYLVAIVGCYRLAHPEPVLADWFTGVLRVPRGHQLVYVHMGFGSVYEEELHIMIERGRVKGQRVYDNRGKEHNETILAVVNLPGLENRFPGDRDFN